MVTGICVGDLATNCYLVYDEKRKEAFLVDPGDNADRIERKISEKGLNLKAVLLTHGHFDHFLAVEDIRRKYSVPVFAYEKELSCLEDPEINLSLSFLSTGKTLTGVQGVTDKEILHVAGFDIIVLFTPGHSAGSCCYYLKGEGIVFSGDTLFCNSVGNTSFPGGNTLSLMQSIRSKLYQLPEKTEVFPGHGDITSIGVEMRENPFVAASREEREAQGVEE